MRKKERIIYIIVTILFILFTLTPILWMVSMSLTPESKLFSNEVGLIPKELYLGNFQELFTSGTRANQVVMKGIFNTLKISLLTILIGVPTSFLASYGFFRYDFKGKRFTKTLLLISMTIPVFTTIIPIYAIYAKYGLLNKLFYISIIYISSIIPVNTWMMLTYLKSIPSELLDAALVDGSDEFKLFTKLILPLSKPVILTSSLIIFLTSWSMFQIPMILTSSQNVKVITLVISEFISRDAIQNGMIAASGVLAILPPIILAIIFRKLLVSGLTQGAVKG